MDKQEIKNYIEELVDAHAFIKGSKLVTEHLGTSSLIDTTPHLRFHTIRARIMSHTQH